MLLEVKDLWVHHGRAPALKGVTLAVSEGSLVALVGPNGVVRRVGCAPIGAISY